MKNNYANIASEYAKKETAKVVLIPVPYNGTDSWQKGSDKGPEAILKASESIELYDIETDSEVYKQGIFLADAISENKTPETMSAAVYENVKTYLNTKKFVTIVGGEHSVSIGTIKAFNEHFDNLTVLQIDAHAGIRKEYKGSKINHSCSMYHASQVTNLVQVGVRSMGHIEKTVIDYDKVFFAHDLATDDYWMENAIEAMTDNVYISFDLDGFDPSIMPSVGNPEPGGLFWYETLDFLRKVFEEKNVVGFDLVELCPNEHDKTSDALAAKLYYKMLSYKFELEKDDSLGIDEDDFSAKKNKIGKFSDDEE
ncbi:agmatinase [Wenyingzhuangia marina]|uniref:Agmatinase n=1 Tax=Wenyingzhuangia marina TaxID=1195760 RepID=A0A1M5W3N2_9FLAO|nr:agmatinase [Wenyingzhuangia marina]GGF76114.1 agmatinase [Wenyingzhuangia marina]SHH82087.1 agmatinase [Wenyingzhuangia marina]